VTDILSNWLSETRIDGLLSRNSAVPILSFEFIPLRTDAMELRLWHYIRHLAPLAPHFVSVTYGAGGTTQAGTLSTVLRLKRDTDLIPAAHLTCVGATRADVNDLARCYRDAGVNYIVALRGDLPAGVADYSPRPGWHMPMPVILLPVCVVSSLVWWRWNRFVPCRPMDLTSFMSPR